MNKLFNTKGNYMITIGLVLLIICACIATRNLYTIFKENRIKKSPLATNQVLYSDLSNLTKEINADSFLVVSYVQDSDIYSNEKEIKKELNKKNLLENVLYLDVTEHRNEVGFTNSINKKLALSDNLAINNLPAVIFYKDGIATYSVDSSNHLLNVDDFEQIIDMYELAS